MAWEVAKGILLALAILAAGAVGVVAFLRFIFCKDEDDQLAGALVLLAMAAVAIWWVGGPQAALAIFYHPVN
jgi:hypothetical protein